MAQSALDLDPQTVLAAYQSEGPEVAAKALQKWRGMVLDETIAAFKDDPSKIVDGMAKFDAQGYAATYQKAFKSAADLGPTPPDLGFTKTMRTDTPLQGPGGGTVGSYNLVFGEDKDYAIVQRNDSAYEEGPSKPLVIPIEKGTPENIKAEKLKLEASIAELQAKKEKLFDEIYPVEPGTKVDESAPKEMTSEDQFPGPLGKEMMKVQNDQTIAKLRLAELSGPGAAYAFAAGKMADSISTEHSNHFQRFEPSEDLWRGVRTSWLNLRSTFNRLTLDPEEAKQIDMEASQNREDTLGTVQYGGNFASRAANVAGEVSEVVGGQAINIGTMIGGGIGVKVLQKGAAVAEAVTLGSMGMQAYGNSRVDSMLRAMQERNNARQMSELGMTTEAQQFETRAQEIEDSSHSRGLLSAANEVAWERVYPEHKLESLVGAGFLKRVGIGARQNFIEEYGTSMTQSLAIDPVFGYDQSFESARSQALKEGIYGAIVGGIQTGALESVNAAGRWLSKPTASPVAAAVPAAEPLTTLAGIANDQGNTPVEPSSPAPAPESKVLISNDDGRFVSTPEGWRQLHDPANLPEGAREDGTTDVAPEMAARLNQDAAQKQNAPSLADLNARVRQVYGPNAWVARYGEMYSVPLGLNGKGGNAVQDGGVPLDELLKIIGWNQNDNQNVNPEPNSESTSGNPTTEETPVHAWQEGSYAQVEGYDGQLRRNGERWELHTADNKIIEINEDTVVTPRPETVADFRAKVESGEASPTVQEASFTPHPDGTLALQDSNGQTWYPQNARLSRTITGQGSQLNVRLRTKEGRIVNLRGDQAIQAQDALLARAAAMEEAGQPVRLSIGDALPENPLTPEAVTAHAASLGVEPGKNVRVVNDPQENWEGRKNADGTIELNAARLATPEDVTRVMQHEAAHLAEEDADMAPTIDALMSAIPSEVRAEMQQAIRDLGYEETAIPSEEVANFAQQLNQSFGQLPAWTRLLTKLKTWAKQKLAMNLTYRDAQALAARIIARGLQMAQSDLRSNSPSKLSRPAHAQPLDEPVLTPSGYVPMGSLQIGDIVVTPYGSSRIMQIHEFGQRPLYRVTVDGKSTRATADHRWQARQLGTDGECGVLDSAFLLALHRSGAGVEIPMVDLNLN